VAELFKATQVDLAVLFDGNDPFAPSEPKGQYRQQQAKRLQGFWREVTFGKEPTDSGRVRATHESERPRAASLPCRAGYTSALMYERPPISTSDHARKSRRRQ